MKPLKTITNCLPSLKDPFNLEDKIGVVYEIPCRNYDFENIGQTKKDIQSQKAEYQRAIKNQTPKKSVVCQHTMLFDLIIHWNNSCILKVESNYNECLKLKHGSSILPLMSLVEPMATIYQLFNFFPFIALTVCFNNYNFITL